MKKNFIKILLLLFSFITIACSNDKLEVLFLSSYNQNLPWSQSLKKNLENQGKNEFIIYNEYLDVIRFKNDFDDKVWVNYLSNKYKQKNIEAVLVDSTFAYKFMHKYKNKLWKNIPIITYSNKKDKTISKNVLNIVPNELSILEKNLNIALSINKNIKNIYYIDTPLEIEQNLKKELKELVKKQKLNFFLLDNLTFEQYKIQLSKLNKKSDIVIFRLLIKDKNKIKMIPRTIVENFAQVSKAPILVIYSTFLNTKALGGNVIDTNRLATSMLEAIKDYKQTGKFKDTYIVTKNIFDEEVLNKFKLNKKKFPMDSEFINKENSIFINHPIESISALIFIFILFFIILILLFIKKALEKTNKELTKVKKEKLELKELLELFDKGDSVLFRWDNNSEYSVEYVSKNVKNLLGYTQDEFLSKDKTYNNCIFKDDYEKIVKEVEDATKEGKEFFKHTPYRVITKNGNIKWVLDYTVVIKKPNGQIEHFLGYLMDITTHVESQRKIEESEYRWKFAVEGSGDGLWDWNLKTNKVYFSPKWKEILGFKVDEIEEDFSEWEKRVHPKDIKKAKFELNAHLTGKKKSFINEHRLMCKDGNYKWILSRGVIVQRDEEGNPVRVIGTHTDIDKNKKILQEVKLLKNRFTNLFNNHDSIMLLVKPQTGQILDANISAQNFYGYTHKEFLKLNISQINTLSKEEVLLRREQAMHYNKNAFEFDHKLKDGSLRTVEVHSSPIETDEGIILFSIIKNITKEKQIEKDFIKEKNFINTILENANAIVAIIDKEGRMVRFNKYAQEFTEYSIKEISSEPFFWKILLPEHIKKDVINIIINAKKGKLIKHFENEWISKSGNRKVFEWSNTLVKNEKGEMDYIATIGIDITDKKLLETQSKLASMGEMIGNIAHQWRQPLSVITSVASSVRLKNELKILELKELPQEMETITSQAQYLSKTIDDFRNFISNNEQRKQILVSDIIKKTISLLKSTFMNNNIEVVTTIDIDFEFGGYENEFIQALINILNNAKDALKEKTNDRKIFIETTSNKKDKLLFIKDNAGGIDEKIISRIFEPYFTTKHKSQGTGLGLSMTHKILLEHHNATISVENSEFLFDNKKYKGANFIINFK